MTTVRGWVLILLVMGAIVGTAHAATAPKKPVSKKPADKPAGEKPDVKPLGELTPLEGMFKLGGQAGAPAYLKLAAEAVASLEGISRGEGKSVDSDFAGKDFVFDLLMKFEKEDNKFFFGIGENIKKDNAITNSLGLTWSGRSGYCDLLLPKRQHESLGRFEAGGVHLLRAQKKGNELTFSVATREGNEGAFKVVGTKTFTDLAKSAAFLTDKNSTLFFSGEATVMAVGLSVGGKPVDPGAGAVDAKAVAAAADAVEKVPLTSLAGAAGIPSWLKAASPMLADGEGLTGGEIRTSANDLFEKDFVCDLLFKFTDEGENRSIAVIGMGENGREGNWILNSVYSRVHAPGHKGECTLAIGKGRDEMKIGAFGDRPGPHMFRIEKRGSALTMGVCVDYKDKYVPTFARTIPDLKKVATFLNKLNGGVFFDGNGGARLMAMRLIVDGKAVENTAALAKKADDSAIDKTPLSSLAGQAGLPAWLKADSKALAGAAGIRGGELRTIDRDLISKDFTFDLLYEFKDEEASIFLIGMGENGRNGGWILNSVLSRVHGPGHDGQATVTLPKGQMHEPLIGRTPKNPGPHLFRLQKRGNTLTMAICVNFKDKFEATFSRTIPDLAKVAPFLTKNNSGIFVAGDCNFKAVRMVVDGQSAAPSTTVAGAGGAPAAVTSGDAGKSQEAAPIDEKAPLISVAGQAGLPAWLKGDAKVLASAVGIKGGELRTLAHDLGAHDFVLDVLYQFEEGDGSITPIGIGEGDVEKTICARIHGPEHEGQVMLQVPGGQWEQPVIGKTLKLVGPHLFRLEKRGKTLTMAVHANYTGGAFTANFAQTIPDLSAVGKFLTSSNGSLYIQPQCIVKAVRFLVDGKPAEGGGVVAAGAAAKPAVIAGIEGVENMMPMGGPKLPAYFQPQAGLKFEKGALVIFENYIRTARSDYLSKDFTFDILYRIDRDQYGPLVMGLGDPSADRKGVTARLHGTRHEGMIQLAVSNEHENEVGKIGKSEGLCMARLQKHGNALTLSVCADFNGKFDPSVTCTIPDLKSVAPYLNEKNAYLFIFDHGRIEKTRLVISGEAPESIDVALGIPARVPQGQALRLQLSKGNSGAKFEIEKAPKGMTLSANGDLAWTPAADQLGAQEMRIRVIRNGQTVVVPGAVEVVSAEDAKLAKGDLTKVDGLYRLPLENKKYHYAAGLGGTSMLLLDGDSLRRLERDGITVRQTLKLPAKYTLIGERETYFVAVSDEKKSLDFIDKRTLAVTKSIQMNYRTRTDLALHPFKAISYLTVEKAGGEPRDSVLIVDESNGDVFEPESFVGRWIKLSPDGQTAYTGYKDIYRAGSRLLVNPDRIDLIPEYGSIDVLYVWDLSTGRPRCVRMKNAPGLNGFGIALSPDGKRLSYLSFTGYPLYSHDVPAFDPTNFEKRPVTYPTKANHADSQDIAFHPYLEIAAAPSKEGAIAFDRETGEAMPGLLDLASPPMGEVKATHVYFSADGRNLLVECEAGTLRFLRKVKLNLSAQQLEKIKAMEKLPAALPPKPATLEPRGAGLPKA